MGEIRLNGVSYGGSSKSGGHVIQDASGTDLTQEPKLQFGGMLKATDDSENGVTKVSDLAEEVEWSTWNAMTEAQRTAYSAGKKLDIINVPSVSGSIPVELLKTLWENPNPTAEFAAQNITLASDDYDFLIVLYNPMIGINVYLRATAIISKGAHTILSYTFANDDSVGCANRWFVYVNDTTYSADVGYGENSGSTRSQTNGACVPVAIYGIKSSVNVDMSALVANVSTSASKCMLSDGETSVEDAIDELTSNNIGTGIMITAGTAYTTPSNGYIQIYVKANSEIDVSVLSSGNNNGVRFDVINTASSGIYQFTYVTKGLRILWSASTANNGAVSFNPLA